MPIGVLSSYPLFFGDMKRRIEANADKTTPEKLLNLVKLE